MKKLFTGFLLLFSVFCWSQEYSLNELILKGETNYPLTKQHQLIEANTELRLKKLNAQYYPNFDLIGQASWQNDVPHIESDDVPFELPMAPKDQYKAYVDLKQVIYDGGVTAASKKVETLKSEVEHQKVKVDIYGIRSGIINSFFLIQVIEEQMKQIDYRLENINKKLNDMQIMADNGNALQSNVNSLKVEILKMKQSRYGLEEAQKAAVQILSEYCGEELSESASYNSNINNQITEEITRPELNLFKAQREQLQATNSLVAKRRIPKISGFGQFGYGNPGFNMLLDSFEPTFIIGARLTWNIWDWKSTSNERKAILNQSSMLTNQEEAFLKNLRIGSIEIQSRIHKMERMMETDKEIIELQVEITKSSEVQLNNGVIMASDYITDLNKESIARLSYSMHQIELNKAKAELINLLGSNL